MLTHNFEVLPAIDVLSGRVVRLSEGRREAVTLEGGDPEALARRYRDEGAARLHVVDLDGAFDGAPTPALLERLGIAALECDGLAASLGEPHDAAREHVDRGQHFEATC